jgi:hypothetical protein
VVTFPPDTTRIWLLPASATYNVAPLTATPAAIENFALATVPLANPGSVPAVVETVPPVAKAWSVPNASDTPSETAITFPACRPRRPKKHLRNIEAEERIGEPSTTKSVLLSTNPKHLSTSPKSASKPNPLNEIPHPPERSSNLRKRCIHCIRLILPAFSGIAIVEIRLAHRQSTNC